MEDATDKPGLLMQLVGKESLPFLTVASIVPKGNLSYFAWLYSNCNMV